MSLIFPSWLQHQRAGIRNVLTTRISRAKQQSRSRGFAHEDLLAPYAMTYVSIACLMSKDFGVYMQRAGAGGDAYLLRTLQWIGQKAVFTGEVDVCRSDFAFEVLGNRYAKRPGRAIGTRVYDALVASTIAVPSTPELVAEARLTALGLAKAAGRYAVSIDGGPVAFHDVCTDACTGSGNTGRNTPSTATRNGHRNAHGNVTSNDGSGDRGSGNGDLQIPNPNPSPGGKGFPSADAGEPEPDPEALAELRRVVRETAPPPDADAAWLHDELERRLRELGWSVDREVPVADRGDGRAGAIDLVVTEPAPIAIELDRRSPRRKSIEKLAAFDGARVVVLREPPRSPIREPGVEVLVAGGQRVELRAGVRERYETVLDYVVCCAPIREQTAARARRLAYRAGQVTDDEIAAQLGSDYAWVTAERLGRWAKEGGA